MSNQTQYLPTSDLETFQKMLQNPNTHFTNLQQINNVNIEINKPLVILNAPDSGGVGYLRGYFPFNYLHSQFERSKTFNLIQTQSVMIEDERILSQTRCIWLQRTCHPFQLEAVKRLKALQPKYGYRIVYDHDDLLANEFEGREGLPLYNVGRGTIPEEIKNITYEIASMADTVTVSTKYLGKFFKDVAGIPEQKIVVLDNVIPKYLYGGAKKKPIKDKIVKPKVVYTGSPTHWSDEKRLMGDMTPNWYEWICKNVIEDKIDFIQMSSLPWFFEHIKDKITVVPWANSFVYPSLLRSLKADFSICPLTDNAFNSCKSDLKAIESYANGYLCIGTKFRSGYDSPYDNIPVNVYDDISVDEIEKLVRFYCEPDNYNKIVKKQYDLMETDGRWLESPKYINKITSLI